MKRKDRFSLLYVVSAFFVVIGLIIAILGFVQENGWIQLVEVEHLTIPGLSIVIIASLLSAWARKKIRESN